MKRHPIWIIIFTILIDTLGIGILGPILPQLLGNPASPHYLLGKDAAVRSGYIMFGFLVAVFPVMQFFATPILGQLSDRYGRKPVLALSLAGTALGYALFAMGIILKQHPAAVRRARARRHHRRQPVGGAGGHRRRHVAAGSHEEFRHDRRRVRRGLHHRAVPGRRARRSVRRVVVQRRHAVLVRGHPRVGEHRAGAVAVRRNEQAHAAVRRRFHAGRRQHRARLRDAAAAADLPDVVLLQRRLRVLHLVLRRVPDSPLRLQRSAHRQLLRAGSASAPSSRSS